MPVNEEERSLRRRIVFNAMSGNATEQAIKTAITTLDSEFGNSESFRFNQLIHRLQSTLDSAEVNLGKVLGEIMNLRRKSPEEIGPDPGAGNAVSSVQTKKPLGSTARPASSRTGLHQVFATLIEAIVGQLRNRRDDSHNRLIAAIVDSPEIQKLKSSLADDFRAFGEFPEPGQLVTKATETDYRVTVHVAYVWLCQKLGPVDADRLLNAAVRAADQLPEAAIFPPRALL